MANAKRGEIDATLDGKTLHALPDARRARRTRKRLWRERPCRARKPLRGKRRLSARDILRIIGCGLRGAGHDISDEDVARMKVSEGLAGYVRIAAELLAATFGDAPEQSTRTQTLRRRRTPEANGRSGARPLPSHALSIRARHGLRAWRPAAPVSRLLVDDAARTFSRGRGRLRRRAGRAVARRA